MTVYNLGSINLDWFYAVPHFPGPGETLSATGLTRGLGGKGANQSVAAARSGAPTVHLGAVGASDAAVLQSLADFGVDVRAVERLDGVQTGHALIFLEPGGENRIVIHAGANALVSEDRVAAALAQGSSADTLMLQNETNGQVAAAQAAQERGMRVVYSAAPFDVDAVQAVLPHVTLLAVNGVEAQQMQEALGRPVSEFPVAEVLVSKGAEGATWHDLAGGRVLHAPSPQVEAVDTTGAGDTLIGYFAGRRERGCSVDLALTVGVTAGALMVTRQGTADVIPDLVEVKTFLSALSGT